MYLDVDLVACTLLAEAGAQGVSEPALDPARQTFAERLASYDRSVHDSWCQTIFFAPPVDEFFRRRVHGALGRTERLLLAATDEGLDELPPRLLQYLPDLPPGIEYRLVQADLVLGTWTRRSSSTCCRTRSGDTRHSWRLS